MPIRVSVDSRWASHIEATALAHAASETLRLAGHNPETLALTVHITDATTIQQLNRRYRGQNKPTDVLSFSVDEIDPDTGLRYLGDVIIAYPMAEAQARRGGHALDDEMVLLTVHGVLHLLGYDDQAPLARKRMWALQERILEAVGCPLRPPLDDG